MWDGGDSAQLDVRDDDNRGNLEMLDDGNRGDLEMLDDGNSDHNIAASFVNVGDKNHHRHHSDHHNAFVCVHGVCDQNSPHAANDHHNAVCMPVHKYSQYQSHCSFSYTSFVGYVDDVDDLDVVDVYLYRLFGIEYTNILLYFICICTYHFVFLSEILLVDGLYNHQMQSTLALERSDGETF